MTKPAYQAVASHPEATLALPRQKVKPHSHSPATIRIIQSIISDVVLIDGCSNIRRLLLWTHKDNALGRDVFYILSELKNMYWVPDGCEIIMES